MAKQIYETAIVHLMDGTELYITPLKIKYLREFMKEFDLVKESNNDEDTLRRLSNCVTIAMKQFYPTITTVEQLEDCIDINTIYKILNVSAGIKLYDEEDKEKTITEQVQENGSSWDDLDLVSLESEAFLLGIWKDYEDLERSLCMAELTAILHAKREKDYNDKKFHAAMQGVDLDEQSGNKTEDPWEAMKSRVFGGNGDPNDVTSLVGPNAKRAGFGIGDGLTYERWD